MKDCYNLRVEVNYTSEEAAAENDLKIPLINVPTRKGKIKSGHAPRTP